MKTSGKKYLAATSVFLVMSMSQTVYAQNTLGDVGVYLKAGTNGFGFDFTKSFTPEFKMRAGYSTYDYKHSFTTSSKIEYDGKLQLGGWNVLGDYHLLSNGFRLTGGALIPRLRFAGNGAYQGDLRITINGHTYNRADIPSLHGEGKWSGVKPYLGIGYDGFYESKEPGFFFSADAGAAFIGSAKTSLTGQCASLSASACQQLQEDLQVEKVKLDEKIHQFKWFPLIQVGVGYRF